MEAELFYRPDEKGSRKYQLLVAADRYESDLKTPDDTVSMFVSGVNGEIALKKIPGANVFSPLLVDTQQGAITLEADDFEMSVGVSGQSPSHFYLSDLKAQLSLDPPGPGGAKGMGLQTSFSRLDIRTLDRGGEDVLEAGDFSFVLNLKDSEQEGFMRASMDIESGPTKVIDRDAGRSSPITDSGVHVSVSADRIPSKTIALWQGIFDSSIYGDQLDEKLERASDALSGISPEVRVDRFHAFGVLLSGEASLGSTQRSHRDLESIADDLFVKLDIEVDIEELDRLAREISGVPFVDDDALWFIQWLSDEGHIQVEGSRILTDLHYEERRLEANGRSASFLLRDMFPEIHWEH